LDSALEMTGKLLRICDGKRICKTTEGNAISKLSQSIVLLMSATKATVKPLSERIYGTEVPRIVRDGLIPTRKIHVATATFADTHSL